MNQLKLFVTAASLVILAGCSINIPRDDDYHNVTTSCSVKCPGKGKAEVSCAASKTPACSCEPTPTAACIESGPRSM